MLQAKDAMQEAREAFLNDAAGTTWDNAVLLPYLKSAYGMLQLHLFASGLVVLDEVSAVLTVAALAKTVTTPSDLLQPIELLERPTGTTLDFSPLDPRDWEPTDDASQFTTLSVYSWREGEIKFRGCSVSTDLLIRYRKELSAIADENSNIPVLQSKPYLSAKTAALASGFGGANIERSKYADRMAEVALGKLTTATVKDQQAIGYRRKPYGWTRRHRRAIL